MCIDSAVICNSGWTVGGQPPRIASGLLADHFMVIFERYLRTLLIAVLFLTPLIPSNNANHTGGIRALIVWAAVLGLVALAVTRPGASIVKVVKSWPDIAVIGLILWAAILFLLRAPESGLDRGIALAEVLRLAGGAALYFGVRYAITTRRQLRDASVVILAGTILVAVVGIASADPSHEVPAAAAYGNKQLLAAFLVGLLPFAAVSVRCGPSALHRRLAWLAVVTVSVALLLTGNRTSWIAGLAGLAVAEILTRFKSSPAPRSVRRTAIVAIGTAMCIAGILALCNAGGMLRSRTVTWRAAITTSSRLTLWHAAVEMIRQRPIAGWGVGSFAWEAQQFGNGAIEFMPPQQLQRQGPSLSTTAHNEYLQMAAEMGIVGLGLYLAVLVYFFVRCGEFWVRSVFGQRRCFVAAALAAVAAQSLDAVANPGWHYPEVAPMLWLMLGIGLASRRGDKR